MRKSIFSPWKNRLNHLSKISILFFGTISSPTLILILHAPFISFAPVDHALLYLYTIISLRLFDLSNRPSVTFCHCHLTVILYLPFVFVYCKAIIIIIIIIIIIYLLTTTPSSHTHRFHPLPLATPTSCSPHPLATPIHSTHSPQLSSIL